MTKIITQSDHMLHIGKAIRSYADKHNLVLEKPQGVHWFFFRKNEEKPYLSTLELRIKEHTFALRINQADDFITHTYQGNAKEVYLHKLIFIDYAFAMELQAVSSSGHNLSYSGVVKDAFANHQNGKGAGCKENDYFVHKGIADTITNIMPHILNNFLTCSKKMLIAGLVCPKGELQKISKSWKKEIDGVIKFQKFFNKNIPEGENRFKSTDSKLAHVSLDGGTLEKAIEDGRPIIIAEGIATAITAHMVVQTEEICVEYTDNPFTIASCGLLRITDILLYIEFKGGGCYKVCVVSDVGKERNNRLNELLQKHHKRWREALPSVKIFAPSERLDEGDTDLNDLFQVTGLTINMLQNASVPTTVGSGNPPAGIPEDSIAIYINGMECSALFDNSDEVIVVCDEYLIYFYHDNELLTPRPIKIGDSKIFGCKSKTATETLYTLHSVKASKTYKNSSKLHLAFCGWNLLSKDKLLYKNDLLVLNNWWLPVAAYKRDNSQEAKQCLMRLLEALTESDAQKGWLLSWMCHLFQTPAARINRSPVLYSLSKGIGKGTLAFLLSLLLHDRYAAVTLDDLICGSWNSDILNRTLICVEEARIQKRHTNKLKDILTAEQKRCKEKYKNSYQVNVNQRFMFHTNEIRAIGVEAGERRFQVLFGETKLEKDFFFNLYTKQAHNKGFLADMYAFLNDPATITVPIESIDNSVETTVEVTAFGDLEHALFEFLSNRRDHPSWLQDYMFAVNIDIFLSLPCNRYFKKHQVIDALKTIFRFESIRVNVNYKTYRIWVPTGNLSEDVYKKLFHIGEDLNIPLEKYFDQEALQYKPQHENQFETSE